MKGFRALPSGWGQGTFRRPPGGDGGAFEMQGWEGVGQRGRRGSSFEGGFLCSLAWPQGASEGAGGQIDLSKPCTGSMGSMGGPGGWKIEITEVLI